MTEDLLNSVAPPTQGTAPPLDELRSRKAVFDNTWMLATILAAVLAIASWYLGLVQVDMSPVIWTLASLALAQFGTASLSRAATSQQQLQTWVLVSQLLGTIFMGLAWHLFGGLQQPIFPLFMLLPLLAGSLLLSFWQQQSAVAALIAVLISGVLLSPDTNSFIEERYGLSILSSRLLPAWLPRSRIAFPDVTTSPSYNLMLVGTVAVVAFALSTAARALVALWARGTERVRTLENDVNRLQELTKQIITRAPSTEALVMSMSGRIVNASDRFLRAFDVSDASGQFLLDSIQFAYPAVIKRLMMSGGEEIQGATVRGRDVVLRVRAEVIGWGAWQVAILNIESCDDICWRGQVDALDEPVFAVNSRGEVVFLNRSALQVFGAGSEGGSATKLFNSGTVRWWDIAPLQSARRTLDRGTHRYVASIRRERIADSIGELSFVHLYDRGTAHVAQAS